MLQKNIPILRIFDVSKAKEFYIDWLGFKINFEHPPITIGVEPTLHIILLFQKIILKYI